MSFSQILGCLMAAALLTLAFWLLKRKQPVPCTITAAIAAIVLLVSMFAKGELFVFKNTLSAEQFLCWLFAAAFLRLAYDFIKQKDCAAYAFLIFIVAAFTCFCGLSGVQAILKTHMLFKITESLNSYGEKIDSFQTNVTRMNLALEAQQSTNDAHQAELTKLQIALRQSVSNVDLQQTEITNQYRRLAELNNELAIAQTNLLAQQQKIEDVEYVVQNLFKSMTNETFSAANKNSCKMYPGTNGEIAFILRLSHIPISGSVRASIVGGGDISIPQPLRGRNSFIANLIVYTLWNYDTNRLAVEVEYAIDSRPHKMFYEIPPHNQFIFTDKTVSLLNSTSWMR